MEVKKEMHLTVGRLNGEPFEFIYQRTENSEFFQIWVCSKLSKEAIEQLAKIMGWCTMPYERIMHHVKEGLLVNLSQINFILNKEG